MAHILPVEGQLVFHVNEEVEVRFEKGLSGVDGLQVLVEEMGPYP